jgi:heat shock protein HslJ
MRVLKTDGTIELRQVTVVVNVANPLADTGWQLVARNVNIPPLPDSTITLLFAADQLSGAGGCNTYNGAYAVTGNNLSISPLAITRSSCGEELDAQEAAYVQALQGATSYQIIGAQLILRDSSGAEVLRYNRTS